MKTGRKTQLIKRTSHKLLIILTLFSSFIYSSCEKSGSDGLPGMAFLSVNWDISKPTYLDVGTSDIPNVFEWGTYYRAYPGINTLIYEGSVWKGTYWADYAWEVDYEIFENPGESGRPNYNGRDGMNSYFDIICTPYGPDITNYNALVKPNENTNDINAKADIISLFKNNGNFSIKITYKKITPKYKYPSDLPVEAPNGSAK